MIEINLLPWREQLKTKRQNKKIAEVIFASLLATLVLGAVHFILLEQLRVVRANLLRTQSGISKVNQSLEELRLLFQEFDYQKLPEIDLSTLLSRQQEILFFLRKLPELMPAGLYLQQLNFDERAWSVEGAALALADILVLAERLKNNLRFVNLSGALKKEKFLNIKQKNGLFYYQLRFEVGL